MDHLFYRLFKQGTSVFWFQSAAERPYQYTICEGVIADVYEIEGKFYYHTNLVAIHASEEWQHNVFANGTYPLINIDTGKPQDKFIYFDCTKPLLDDWRSYYAAQWYFDLTADLVFDTFNAAVQGLSKLMSIIANNVKAELQYTAEYLSYLNTQTNE